MGGDYIGGIVVSKGDKSTQIKGIGGLVGYFGTHLIRFIRVRVVLRKERFISDNRVKHQNLITPR